MVIRPQRRRLGPRRGPPPAVAARGGDGARGDAGAGGGSVSEEFPRHLQQQSAFVALVVMPDRLDGTEPAGPAAPIGTEFIPALRAEADGTELAVAAALPLATVAASIAELEQAS